MLKAPSLMKGGYFRNPQQRKKKKKNANPDWKNLGEQVKLALLAYL